MSKATTVIKPQTPIVKTFYTLNNIESGFQIVAVSYDIVNKKTVEVTPVTEPDIFPIAMNQLTKLIRKDLGI